MLGGSWACLSCPYLTSRLAWVQADLSLSSIVKCCSVLLSIQKYYTSNEKACQLISISLVFCWCIWIYYLFAFLLVLGDIPEFQPLRRNIPVSRLQTYSISTTLHTFPHTKDNSIIHTQTHLQVNLRLLAKSRSPRYSDIPRDTLRYSEVLCIYHCCIVDSLVCTPLRLYLLICSICDFVYNSGLILAEALSYSFRTSC